VNKQTKKRPSAFKHGGFAGATILPGEDRAAFNKLHRDLRDDFAPQGSFEEHIVKSIAHLVWRQRNLDIYRLVPRAQRQFNLLVIAALRKRNLPPEIESLLLNKGNEPDVPQRDLSEEERIEMERILEQVQKRMGADYDLVGITEFATIPNLVQELAIVDRLDGMIDRNIKRLLMVRGVKSLAVSAEHSAPPKRLSAA
jgi:hypothetical protein